MEKPALNYLPLHWTALRALSSSIWASPYRDVSEFYFIQEDRGFPCTIKAKHLISPSASLPTNQRGSILTSQDSAFWINQTMRIWSSSVWGWTNQSPRVETYDYISYLSTGSWSTLFLSTQDWRLCFICYSWNTKDKTLTMSHQSRTQ